MIGLPKSIVKKYGVTKKAWQVFRHGSKTRRTHTKKIGVIHMAKRRGHRSYGSKNVSVQGMILPAMVYGAVREKVSDALQPVTSKVPFGGIADELVLGAAAFFLNKKSNNKMVKDFARAALTVETARLGEFLVSGAVMGSSSGGVKVI
jgi:hypothetical protein